ncbi:glycine-rich domain-containing protein [Kitasatospora sp. NPDC008050]|uniref:glycine-rich domain-containing protein n=1 Tax=Kitasatospora sp. NPDC008050 TaxID=3364021 RepID=UPI0036E6F7B4
MTVPTDRPPGPMPDPQVTSDPRTLLEPRHFDGVVSTIADNNPGMTKEVATRIACEGIKFTVAAAIFRDQAMAPSRVVDEGWHALILHTATYAELCERFGGFVHHTPGYDPTFYDPTILDRSQELIRAAGFESDRELWVGPDDRTFTVAANCQHSKECAIRPMPTPQPPCNKPSQAA